MKNIAIIGCGYWGKNLVRNFAELGALYAICDSNETTLKDFKAKYPGLKAYTSTKDVFGDKAVTGVVIAAPAALHYTLAKEALLNDKDIFVEKPLALKVGEGEEIVHLAKERNRILMVGHILYYHKAVNKLKELVDKGELGKIQYIYSNRLNIGKIRTEENILWSFAPHDISVILKLLGEFPQSVSAKGGNYLQTDVSDVTLTIMEFASGAKSHIFVSWLHPFKDQKLVVVGSKKMAVFDDMSKEKLFLYNHRIDWINRAPVASKAEAEVVPLELDEPLKVECEQFITSIKTRQAPPTDGHEGLRVLRVLDAFQESINKNGETIVLAPQAKPYFAHSSAFIDDGVEIGSGTSIWHVSHVLKNSKIGKNCKIGQNVVIGPNAAIGNNCKIQNNVSIYEGVTLEDDVFCGPSMVFTNIINPRSAIPRMHELKTTLLKKGATIGANATIVCGNTIGQHAFIGAGAVVTKDIPDHALIVGNPGRITGWMCECGVKLSFNSDHAKCASCGKEYNINENIVVQCSDSTLRHSEAQKPNRHCEAP